MHWVDVLFWYNFCYHWTFGKYWFTKDVSLSDIDMSLDVLDIDMSIFVLWQNTWDWVPYKVKGLFSTNFILEAETSVLRGSICWPLVSACGCVITWQMASRTRSTCERSHSNRGSQRNQERARLIVLQQAALLGANPVLCDLIHYIRPALIPLWDWS